MFPPWWSCPWQHAFLGVSPVSPQHSPPHSVSSAGLCRWHRQVPLLSGFDCVWPRGSMDRRLVGGNEERRENRESGVCTPLAAFPWAHCMLAASPGWRMVLVPASPIISHSSNFQGSGTALSLLLLLRPRAGKGTRLLLVLHYPWSLLTTLPTPLTNGLLLRLSSDCCI